MKHSSSRSAISRRNLKPQPLRVVSHLSAAVDMGADDRSAGASPRHRGVIPRRRRTRL